jgi:hypothetical protein
MKNLISINILRAAFFFIFLGLFLPLGCESSGFQIAQGILGKSDAGKNLISLQPVNDFYACLLFAVFIVAIIGFAMTFIRNNKNFLFSFICLILSLVFMVITLIGLNVYFNFNEFSFYIKAPIPIKIELLVGGYLMIIGYISGIGAFIFGRLNSD